ncbi:MAG: tetratricopeptide repeat protein [Candidatus Sericytochromatia bacterium]
MKIISKKSLILALSFTFISLTNINAFANNPTAEQYEANGQLDLALFQYQLDVMNDENNTELLNKIGTLLYRLKRYKEAINYFNKAIKLNNENSIYHYNVGMSYVKMSNDKEAFYAFKRAIYVNPNVDKYYHKLGNLYYSHQKYEQAIVEYNNVLKLNDRYPEAYYNLGLSYKELQDYNKSLSYFQKYLKLKPSDKKALNLYYQVKALTNNGNGVDNDPFGDNKPTKPDYNNDPFASPKIPDVNTDPFTGTTPNKPSSDDPFNNDNDKKMTIFDKSNQDNNSNKKNDSVD